MAYEPKPPNPVSSFNPQAQRLEMLRREEAARKAAEAAEEAPPKIDVPLPDLAQELIDSIAKEGCPVMPRHLQGLDEAQAETLADLLADAGKNLLLQAGRVLEMSKSLN